MPNLQHLLCDLPDVNLALSRARDLATEIKLGHSAFLQHTGFRSEADYKQQCMRDGQIMYHAHLGLSDWPETERALQFLDQEMRALGYQIDRVGLALDRRMALPEKLRARAAAETGPMLVDTGQWQRVAQCALIQPHMGDFMIGMPASVTNTALALQAGVTTIGNLSQYFAFETPNWNAPDVTAVETTTAIALLGCFREQGVMLHSYLEDGYGALFQDCRTVAGWAYLEHYIVEELLGAKLSHCIGGLTADPVRRAGWVFALNHIHGGEHIGSMIYGDTISFNDDFEQNRALVSEYLLWDILAQLHQPGGHAVLPLPVTEAVRIPSAEEVFDAQRLGRRIEQSARRMYPHVDFSAAEAFADEVSRAGKTIFQRALAGLEDEGIDTRDALQLLYFLKLRGSDWFEQRFGFVGEDSVASQPPGAEANDHVVSHMLTDICRMTRDLVAEHQELFSSEMAREKLSGQRLLLASTDVHEHAISALAELLRLSGAEVINLGAEQDTVQVAAALKQYIPDVLLLSTHNGMALEYARQLHQLMVEHNDTTPVLMGGVLNQKVEDQQLPVPVAEDIRKLGFRALETVERLLLDAE
ncbi:MAG: cobalamin B12-binding domain-containing protein [Thiolinea sp.]